MGTSRYVLLKNNVWVMKWRYMNTSKCKHKNMYPETQNVDYEEYQEV